MLHDIVSEGWDDNQMVSAKLVETCSIERCCSTHEGEK